MPTSRIVLAASLCCLLGTGLPSPPAFAQTRDGAGQPFGQPARDTSALDPTAGLAELSGRVLRGDTGAVVKRAMVRLAAQDTRDRRTAQTDDNGQRADRIHRHRVSDRRAALATAVQTRHGVAA